MKINLGVWQDDKRFIGDTIKKYQEEFNLWPKQPVSVRVSSCVVEVYSCDDLHVYKLTSDGHSSTASHWTI